MFLHHHSELELALRLDDDHVIVDKADWDAAFQRINDPTVLSRRNLLTLLHKLTVADSSRTLIKPGNRRVIAQPDEECYANRAPGPMAPDTERFIRLMDQAMKVIQGQMENNDDVPVWAVNAAKIVANECSPMHCTDSPTCVCTVVAERARAIYDAFKQEYGL